MCIAPQWRALFLHLNFQKWSEPGVLCTFDLEMCIAPQWRALSPHLNFQKWSEPGVLCTFDLDMCFAPQRRALFRQLNFQKCSEREVLLPFWLGNVHRATTARTFSSLIWPAGSAPAALAMLLFDPPEPQIIRKTQWIATSLPFRAPASCLFRLSPSLIFSLLDFSSLTLPTSAFTSLHIVGSLTSKLPSPTKLEELNVPNDFDSDSIRSVYPCRTFQIAPRHAEESCTGTSIPDLCPNWLVVNAKRRHLGSAQLSEAAAELVDCLRPEACRISRQALAS